MRRTVSILLVSFSLSGLWGQLWHLLWSPPAGGGRLVPTCGGTANPDGGCQSGTTPH